MNIKEAIKTVFQIEAGSLPTETEEIGKVLIAWKIVEDTLESISDLLKANFLAEGEDYQDVESLKKVTIESKNATVHDIKKIYESFRRSNRLAEFAKAVSIVQKKVDTLDKKDQARIAKYSKTTLGNDYVKVSNLSKEDKLALGLIA